MRLKTIGFITLLGTTVVMPTIGGATDGSETTRSPPPAQPKLADAPEQIGRSFRQVGDSVESEAKNIGRVVEDGAKQFGRSVSDGWRSFKRGLTGE